MIEKFIDFTKALQGEYATTIRDVQISPGKALNGCKIILNNGKPQGVYIDYEEWIKMIELLDRLHTIS